jgi:hypothetical protein
MDVAEYYQCVVTDLIHLPVLVFNANYYCVEARGEANSSTHWQPWLAQPAPVTGALPLSAALGFSQPPADA